MNFVEKTSFISFFKAGAKDFFDYVNRIIGFVLLAIVYVVGVSLTFVIAQVLKKEFLDLNINKNTNTYWEDFEQGNKLSTNYFRQF